MQSLNFDSMATRREILNSVKRVAEEIYPEEEALQIARMIVMWLGGISYNELIVEPEKELIVENLEAVLQQLRAWCPVQYITGVAQFADMELEVAEGVLNPRPETEELVEWIAERHPVAHRIVDLCTGSGCIALALARRLSEATIRGVDISTEALAVARRNGVRYAPHVEFVDGDVLEDMSQILGDNLDVVVSNPPYIPQRDIGAMRRNVTEYEPHVALFVPDDDPLLFYRAIARSVHDRLAPRGALYFEIYEEYAEQMCEMLAVEGYAHVEVRDDFRGKPRMICAVVG